MRARSVAVSALVALVMLLLPSMARAEGSSDEQPRPAPGAWATGEERPREPAPRWHLTGGLGGFNREDGGGGLVLEFLGLRRVGAMAFGLELQSAMDGLKSSSSAIAPALGVFLDTSRSFDVGLVATLGARFHHVADNGLLSDDPGVDGTTGMVSIRTVTAVCFGRKASRFSLGLSLFVDDDLARKRPPAYDYSGTGLLGGSYTTTTSHTIGTLREGVILALGATL